MTDPFEHVADELNRDLAWMAGKGMATVGLLVAAGLVALHRLRQAHRGDRRLRLP
jgi:hypothetical protein